MRKMEILDREDAALAIINKLIPRSDEQLKKLRYKDGEDAWDYINRNVAFFITEMVRLYFNTNDEKIKLAILKEFKASALPEKTIIDITARRSKIDDWDDEQVYEYVLSQLGPKGKKLLEDKSGEEEDE